MAEMQQAAAAARRLCWNLTGTVPLHLQAYIGGHVVTTHTFFCGYLAAHVTQPLQIVLARPSDGATECRPCVCSHIRAQLTTSADILHRIMR